MARELGWAVTPTPADCIPRVEITTLQFSISTVVKTAMSSSKLLILNWQHKET